MEARYYTSCRRPPSIFSIILPSGMIFVAEALLFKGDAEGCLSAHLVNIAICTILPMFLRIEPSIWQALSLVSMLRVLNLGVPRFDPFTLHWIPLIYAPIIVLGFLVIHDEGKQWDNYIHGIKRFFSDTSKSKIVYLVLFGCTIAFLLAFLEFIILSAIISNLQILPTMDIENVVLSIIIFFLFISLGEELLFRKILQGGLEKITSPFSAIIITSTIFSIMYLSYGSIFYAAHMFSISVILGVLYFRTSSLALVVFIHGLLDFFLFALIPTLL